jgi:hypothetical protein
MPAASLTIECGTEVYRIERTEGSAAHRPWQVYRVTGETPNDVRCPEALPPIVLASGAQLEYHSHTEFEWRSNGTGDRFWASLSESGWLIDSCERDGTHWYDCDRFALELALGLRRPYCHWSVQQEFDLALRIRDKRRCFPEPSVAPSLVDSHGKGIAEVGTLCTKLFADRFVLADSRYKS